MDKEFNFIKETFLKLTKKTYPYGYEDELVSEMIECGIFPQLQKDEWGNFFYKQGKSRTIFAAHLDTACRQQVDVKHSIYNGIVSTAGNTVLGADDKAGVTVMLYMIKNKIPGTYYFFVGEEVGCIGSSDAAEKGFFMGAYDRIISFDRRGTSSVITHQSGKRCCSDEFAQALSKELNKEKNLFYRKDNTGVYTDSAEFINLIPECTNVSVGYYNEHTFNETQDILHLYKLSKSCLNVDWENLPIKRGLSSYKEEKHYTERVSKKKRRRLPKGRKARYSVLEEQEEWFRANRSYNASLKKPGRMFYDGDGGLIDLGFNSKLKHLVDFTFDPLSEYENDFLKKGYVNNLPKI